MPDDLRTESPEPHGWIGTETVRGRYGEFAFEGGYPTQDAGRRLRETLTFNRAVEVYLAQMPVVSWYRVWRGIADEGAATPNQLVIWETLMDAETLLLTGNTETVYALCAIDLKRDGPVVIEAPAGLLGGLSDLWQREICGIGPTGPDKGQGGKFLLLPPGYTGPVPAGHIVERSETWRAVLGVRGFLDAQGRPERAAAAMKALKVYPLSQAAGRPAITTINGSRRQVDTEFSDTYAFFEDLAEIVATEPGRRAPPPERFQMASIGIEHAKPFDPDPAMKALLGEAARLGSAIARANTFDNQDPVRLVYPDRRWEQLFVGGSATWDAQGFVNTDRRAAFAYAAIGMSPAMVEKIVGGGSQYLFTPRDADGAWLDGAKAYRLRLPAGIPVRNFWSVVVYDAQSRSLLRNGEAFPSVSQYTGPKAGADGAIEIYFGPTAPPGQEKNWIRTVPGKGWFPLVRFYGPLAAFFDQTWKPDDIVPL